MRYAVWVIAGASLLSACGSSATPPTIRLTQPEYQLLIQYEHELAGLSGRRDLNTAAGVRRVLRAERRMCRRAARSGEVLRAMAITCRAAAMTSETMARMPAQVQLCAGDRDCTIGTVLGLEVPLNALWGADRQARRMLKGLKASDGCRDYVLGPDELSRRIESTALAARTLSTRFRAVQGGGGEPTTPAQLVGAADTYDSEMRGLARVMNRTGAIPATACRGDVLS